MLTKVFKIKSKSKDALIAVYQWQYTGLFYKLYNNFELSKDINFKREILVEFPLFDISMLDCCISDVETLLKAHAEQVSGKQDDIERIMNLLKKDDFDDGQTKHKYDLKNKLSDLERTLNNDVCFGGKSLLRRITKAKQDYYKEKDDDKKAKKLKYAERLCAEFSEKRKLGVYMVGRANECGNRKVGFDLRHQRIVFKPSKDVHIGIDFHCTPKEKTELILLQQMADVKEIPITVRLYENKIHLTYDEQLLHGYAFDKNGLKRDLVAVPNASAETRKSIAKLHFQEQMERQLKGKLAGRYAAVDLNPHEISLVIVDKLNDDGDFEVVYSSVFNLYKLSKALRVASSDEKQTHQNNKRKHELKEAICKIFEVIKYYNCGYFVMEDLKFKGIVKANRCACFNRLTKNIWHRELTKRLIEKHCNINGIIKIEVNAAYSSYIGNLIYDDYDCISAAKELARRGIVKFVKGSSIFPDVSRINRQKLIYLFGENVDGKDFSSWKNICGRIALAGLRYRNKDLNPYQVQFMDTFKSNVLIYSERPPLSSF